MKIQVKVNDKVVSEGNLSTANKALLDLQMDEKEINRCFSNLAKLVGLQIIQEYDGNGESVYPQLFDANGYNIHVELKYIAE